MTRIIFLLLVGIAVSSVDAGAIEKKGPPRNEELPKVYSDYDLSKYSSEPMFKREGGGQSFSAGKSAPARYAPQRPSPPSRPSVAAAPKRTVRRG